jgi:hypothetical protein
MDELEYLNTARRWWLAANPKRTVTLQDPTDDEVLAEYRRYHAEGFVLWHRRDECDAPALCRYHRSVIVKGDGDDGS